MAKTVIVGKDRERKLKEQQKAAKLKNKKKRRGPIRFIKDIFSELKKVTWPTKKEWLTATLAVIVFVVIMAIVIGLFDFGLSKLFSLIVS